MFEFSIRFRHKLSFSTISVIYKNEIRMEFYAVYK